MLTNIEMETLTAIKSAARKFTSNEIDWEQRRYEIAKDCYTTFLTKRSDYDKCATDALVCADEIIKQLKETSNSKN